MRRSSPLPRRPPHPRELVSGGRDLVADLREQQGGAPGGGLWQLELRHLGHRCVLHLHAPGEPRGRAEDPRPGRPGPLGGPPPLELEPLHARPRPEAGDRVHRGRRGLWRVRVRHALRPEVVRAPWTSVSLYYTICTSIHCTHYIRDHVDKVPYRS